MDGDGSFNNRHWSYYPPQPTRSLALQLMSNVTSEHDPKPFINHNAGFFRDNMMPQHYAPFEYHYPTPSFLHNRDNKLMHDYTSVGYNIFPNPPMMLQSPEPIEEEEKVPMIEEEDMSTKKRPQVRAVKSTKPRKSRKVKLEKEDDDDEDDGSVSKSKAEKKYAGSMVINGYDLDLSVIPTPVCSCTGTPQQCYRWGIGGWQSACCTISISQYPLPMSSKRKGARIAGRKMSQGAFKKVLERLSGEGHNLSDPIDLKTFWAKHGTNKFVTIR